jgi:prepilin-type processing-associated H-X9-DG protein
MRPVQSQHRSFTRGAFTLVELLVVIGVVAMLMALLLPTIRGMRDQARSAGCVANLSAIGQAFAIYRAGHDNYMPPVYTGVLGEVAPEAQRSRFAYAPIPLGQGADSAGVFAPVGYKVWADVLIDDAGIGQARFVCPSATGEGRVSSGIASTSRLESFLGYGINAYIADELHGKLLGRGVASHGTPVIGSGNNHFSRTSPWPFSLITRPSEGLLLADSFVGTSSLYGGEVTVGAIQNGVANTRFRSGDTRRATNIFRHAGERATNVLHFDGHVSTRQPSTGGTLVGGVPNARALDAILDQPPFTLGARLYHDATSLNRQPSALWRPWKPYFP